MSHKREILTREINGIPDYLLEEVYEYIKYLKFKIKKDQIETAHASEHALAKDWNKEEEDKEWQDL